jgi:histidine triad (HIT) family protein
MSENCVFCGIVEGAIPSTKVYEDSDTLAFMDINPVAKGHTLVIPKQHHNPITGTPPDLLQKVIVSVQKVAKGIFAGLKADGINVTQANGEIAGQIIPHVHFHVIPRFANSPHARNWIPGKYDSQDEIRQYAQRIASAMK